MLAPVVIDGIETVLDVVLAQAPEVMAARPKARAGIGHEGIRADRTASGDAGG
jgi:hypothetical protein